MSVLIAFCYFQLLVFQLQHSFSINKPLPLLIFPSIRDIQSSTSFCFLFSCQGNITQSCLKKVVVLYTLARLRLEGNEALQGREPMNFESHMFCMQFKCASPANMMYDMKISSALALAGMDESILL